MAPETPAASVEELAETREALRAELGQLDWQSTDTPLARYLRQRLQLASVQLAVAVVRRDIPSAAFLALNQGDEGQGQGGYEVLMVLGADGSTLRSVSIWIDSAAKPVAGGTTPSLADLVWSISLSDDTWAEGIAMVANSPLNGKSATIDIDAALAKPAPGRPGNKGALIAHLSATQNVLDIMREQTRQAEDAHRVASLRLAAATILERFPKATTMELRPKSDGSGNAEVYSISGPEGPLYTSGWDGTTVVDGRGEDGTPSLNELVSGAECPDGDGVPPHRNHGRIVISLPALLGPRGSAA